MTRGMDVMGLMEQGDRITEIRILQ
jgi:hypothetical protein